MKHFKKVYQGYKEKLSIELLGKRRFYLGLIIGLIFAILIDFFLAYFREVLRGLTFSSGLIIPTQRDFIFYNFFFAGSSVTIAFGIMVWFWFHGLFSSNKPPVKVNFISTYAMFWSMALLYIISKTGSFLTWIPFSLGGYDDQLNLAREFPLLLFLLPVVFFLNIWAPIRLYYRSGRWLIKSLALFVLLTTTLALNNPIDQNNLNSSWDKYMAPYHKIVDDEIKGAQNKGIIFSDSAISTVKLYRNERVENMAMQLKERFKSVKPISIDSVVLELILVKKTTLRSLKTDDWTNESSRWPYALPRDVYAQLKLSDDSIKNSYLKEILIEYESIFKDEWDIGSEGVLAEKYHSRYSIQNRYFQLHFEVLNIKDMMLIDSVDRTGFSSKD